MELPYLDQAIIPPEKVRDYLLSETHSKGKAKAAFFRSFGFVPRDWIALADALLNHVRTHGVVKADESPFGMRYIVEGRLESPDGRDPRVRSVWFIEDGTTVPRLATAYPLEEMDNDQGT